jgi:hypothetical protein
MQTGVSYFSSRVLKHVRDDLREMADAGCTYVVHCYTETDLAHYRETMGQIAKATHEAGLEVWFDPWGLVGIFSGETFTRFPLEHPETWQVLSDGRRVGAACPNHPATREFLREWIAACAAAGGDVLMWDEPHFYTPLWRRDFRPAWACYCETCLRAFKERYGGDMPREFTPEVKAFREATLLDLLTELSRESYVKGMRTCLCLFPTDLAAHGFKRPAERLRSLVEAQAGDVPASAIDGMMHIGVGDFDSAAGIPHLDIFSTDPYWFLLGVEPEKFMRTYSEEAAAAAKKHGRQLQLWLQAFRVPAGRADELRMGVQVAEDVGATHIAAWSFEATASMSEIACAEPEVVWGVLGEEFRRVRG